MSFTFPQKMLFKHCDPAGIGFYPRFFEMINDCVEAFFSDAIGYPFETMHLGRDGGVPTVEISATFPAPSRHGDMLIFSLDVTRLGRTSMGLSVVARCAGEERIRSTSTLVHIDRTGRPMPWPEQHLPRLQAQLPQSADAT
jgi:4-hydroxybenzoyl-CoA thioesterase